MSDPTLEEESLISQDDIDKLLDASSIEEAEEKLDADDDSPETAMDDIGELSQDDIDGLLNGTSLDSDEEEEAGELSQDDIDSLMGGGASEPEEEEAGELSQDDIDSLMGGISPEEDEEEAGELSQDDIDSLMGGGTSEPEEEAGELSQDDIDSLLGGGDDDEDDEELELISQDDIDRLMNPSDDPSGEDESEDDDELISMDDIQGVLEESEPEEPSDPDPEPVLEEENESEAPEVTPPETESQDAYDQVIEDGDATEVADCLMTQETMDDLIANAPEPGGGESEPAPEPQEPEDFALEEPAPEDPLEEPIDLSPESETVALDEPEDEFDGLLDTDDMDISLDLDGEADGDVTQEDIDALLQESDDDDGFLDEDDDILISQDDIDTLLMAADQEDEDVLGDLMGDGIDDSMDDFDDQDIIDSSIEEDEETDQVVLEGGDGTGDVAEERSNPKSEKIRKLLKSKWILAAASILLVMGISIPAAYFLFFSGKPAPLPEKEVVPLASEEIGRDIEVASVTIEEDAMPVTTRQSGTIVLADFVILASELATDMTYVYADISIDYSDQRAYHEISNNLSFYRDLIYEAIQTNLVSEKRNEVTEADLIWGVENSLKKVLPPHFIEKISFKTFRTS